jgi:hypothetical protein
VKAHYVEKNQRWYNETTIYWFETEPENEVYGIVEPDDEIIDWDGYPVEGDLEKSLREVLVVTDRMRNDW